MGDFDGRAAIVTGAGGGLGRGYAIELARRGCAVLVNDSGGTGAGAGASRAPADAVAAEIVAAGGRAIANHDTVASREGGARIVAAAMDGFGRLDILVGNAGILRDAPFEDMTDDAIDDVLAVHLRGGFHVGQPAFRAMKRAGYGRMLFTASSSGMFGHPWQASYAAAKAGLVGLSNVIALEGAPHGIGSNVIMPNARTRLAEAIDWDWARAVPAVGAVLAELTRTGAGADRLEPEWVVPLAVFLVSEACRETHGVFSAANGRFARVAIGVGEGWLAPALPTVEQVAQHWDRIRNLAGFAEPRSVYDEALLVRRALEAVAR